MSDFFSNDTRFGSCVGFNVINPPKKESRLPRPPYRPLKNTQVLSPLHLFTYPRSGPGYDPATNHGHPGTTPPPSITGIVHLLLDRTIPTDHYDISGNPVRDGNDGLAMSGGEPAISQGNRKPSATSITPSQPIHEPT